MVQGGCAVVVTLNLVVGMESILCLPNLTRPLLYQKRGKRTILWAAIALKEVRV